VASSFLSRLSFWPRFFWRQLTSMRNALILLLLLAVAAVPGSVYPQRSADPNGVKVFYDNEPELAAVLDQLQLFDVYTSVWFSAIYIFAVCFAGWLCAAKNQDSLCSPQGSSGIDAEKPKADAGVLE